MAIFDPRNPPAWMRQLMSRANRRHGTDDGEMISLGLGTFAAPLPAGWGNMTT